MTANRKKLLFIVLLVGVVGLLAMILVFYKRDKPQVSHIPPSGGAVEARYHFSDTPIFLQTDARWASQEIGGSRELLRAVGCTLCSVSMALAHYGLEMTPDKLNENLKIKDGFTAQGWLKWQAITEITGQKIRIDIPQSLSHKIIDQALKANQPVLAKILLGGSIQHWVLIVGKSGQEYLIKDPLGDGKSLDLLSKFGSDIFAVRIVAKVE